MSGRRRRRTALRGRGRGLLLLAAAVVPAGLLARVVLAGLAGAATFTVEQVRLEGTRFLDPAELLAAAGLEGYRAASLSPDELELLGRRVAAHPMVAGVSVRRSLPAAVVIRVQERIPVALLEGSPVHGIDQQGMLLEAVDPARYGALPFVTGVPAGPQQARQLAWQRAAALLNRLHREVPRLLDQVSEVRPGDGHEIALVLVGEAVVVRLDQRRLQGTLPLIAGVVEEGRLRHWPLKEVDLRFEGTVIYRQRERGA